MQVVVWKVLMLANAYQALEAGDAVRAEAIARTILAGEPDSEGALLVQAFALDAQRRVSEAMACFERLTVLFPRTSAHWSNLGSMYRSQGKTQAAADAFERALGLEPNDPSILYNAGLLKLDQGETHAAFACLQKALALEPLDPALRASTANAAFLSGNGAEAEHLLGDWQRWTMQDALALAEVGWLFARLGQADDAEQALAASVKLAPLHPKILLRRAGFLEKSNRVEEAAVLLAQISSAVAEREGLTEDIAILRADIVARGDDINAACLAYEAIVADSTAAKRHPELLSALARLRDKARDIPAAMEWMQQAHALQIEELRNHSPHWLGPGADPLGINRFRFDASTVDAWASIQAPAVIDSPIFVVGFPRSGTTMLETMLDAHPMLAGMDERTFLQDVVEGVRDFGLRYPDDIGRLDDVQAARLRDSYWKLVRTRAKIDASHRLVDKNPLNIVRLPMIRRLFPRAKIILALRHPCDVVLSNYMQTFRTPAYVALTATLASTAKGYADTFDFWISQSEIMQSDVLELRYEDIVDDIEGQSRRIAGFLEIPWDERMVDFHVRAKERGYIATPSYHQVVEPVNRKGIARWERYREYLDPVIPILRPFIERWHYTT